MIDKKTADAIAVKYYDEVYKFCFSHLGCNENEAGDITQDVFLIFQQKCEVLEDKNIKAWLIKTAKNKVHEYYRTTKKKDILTDFDDNAIAYDEDEIFALFDEYFPLSDEEIEKHKAIVLKSLTKNEQELYTKIFVEKKKYKEIAEELNTTEKAISTRALRLRNKIKMLAKLMLTSVGQLIIKIFF